MNAKNNQDASLSEIVAMIKALEVQCSRCRQDIRKNFDEAMDALGRAVAAAEGIDKVTESLHRLQAQLDGLQLDAASAAKPEPEAEAEPKAEDEASADASPSADKEQEDAATQTIVDGTQLPIHSTVARLQKRMFNFKLFAIRFVNANCLPSSPDPIDDDVQQALRDGSARYHKHFLDMHNACKSSARERLDILKEDGNDVTIEAIWDEALLQQYEDFRTMGLLEDYLDAIEKVIRDKRLDDHYELLAYIAMEMDVGRIPIVLFDSPYDPEFHDLAPPVPSETERLVIVDIVSSGYTNLKDDSILRKAVVEASVQDY
jgi:hypothetical protein